MVSRNKSTHEIRTPLSLDARCPCCDRSLELHHDQPGIGFVDPDPYSSDEFRMYHFKVQPCPNSMRRGHNWTECPYLHPGEKARRRDPRKYAYSGTLCTEFRKNGICANRDRCQFAHGVFEAWLHPDKYRTQLCRDGMACRRKVCFFAHTVEQLRWPCDSDSKATADVAMFSSILDRMIADTQRMVLCGIDTFGPFGDGHVNWVSDLVDF